MTSINHLRKNAKLESKWEKRKQEGFSTDGLTERQKDNVNFINAADSHLRSRKERRSKYQHYKA